MIEEHFNQFLSLQTIADNYKKQLLQMYKGNFFKVIKEPIRSSYFVKGERFALHDVVIDHGKVYLVHNTGVYFRSIAPEYVKFEDDI